MESQADELFYGGQAGGGKTDLLLGAALTQHRRAVIFRREFTQLLALEERSRELIGDRGRYNGQDHVWRLPDRTLEFGAAQHEHFVQKWQGRAHDLKAFDELPQFTEAQYLFLIGWARTTLPGQRVRIIGAGNPPMSAEGEWVIRRWAPWLDSQHSYPAEPGALRWFATIDHGDGKGPQDTECGCGEPFDWQGETIYPRSRTFIPARLEDNPYLDHDAGYRAVLQSQPEPLRSQLLYGDFTVGLQDDPWQVIPTAWVRAAMDRWRADGRPKTQDGKPWPLTWTGMDVAEGGDDRTTLARRYGSWLGPLETHQGRVVSVTPDAKPNADLALKALSEGGGLTIDADGLGASTYYLVRAKVGVKVVAFRGSGPTPLTDSSGVLSFLNLRAYAWWRFREWLDPSKGTDLALPPSRSLLAELCAPRWMNRGRGVQIEPKEEIKKRLGRSPDEAEAVVLSLMSHVEPGVGEVVFG